MNPQLARSVPHSGRLDVANAEVLRVVVLDFVLGEDRLKKTLVVAVNPPTSKPHVDRCAWVTPHIVDRAVVNRTESVMAVLRSPFRTLRTGREEGSSVIAG